MKKIFDYIYANWWTDAISCILFIIIPLLLTNNPLDKWFNCHPNVKYWFNVLLWFFLIITILFYLLMRYSIHKTEIAKKKYYDDLISRNKEYERLKAYIITTRWDIVSSFLCKFIIRLKIIFSSNERINLYMKQKDDFLLIGRYSENPNFSKKGLNSGLLPDDGILKTIWENGEDVIKLSGSSFRTWKKEMKKYFTNKTNASNKRMPSCFLYGIRLNGEDNKPKYVLLIESIKSNTYDDKNLKTEFLKHTEDLLNIANNFYRNYYDIEDIENVKIN